MNEVTGGEVLPLLEIYGGADTRQAYDALLETFTPVEAVASCSKISIYMSQTIAQALGNKMPPSAVLADFCDYTARNSGEMAQFGREVWFWQRTLERTGNPMMEFAIRTNGTRQLNGLLIAALGFTCMLLDSYARTTGGTRADATQTCRTAILQGLS